MIDLLIIGLFTLLPLFILGGIGYGVYPLAPGQKSRGTRDTGREKAGLGNSHSFFFTKFFFCRGFP